MSREIKFRIWDGKKKEWLGGSDNDALTYYGFHLVGEVMTVQSPPQWALDEGMVVEQYTGVKDRNGKETYEGDIVTVMGYGTYEVFWREWDSSFSLKPINTVKEENRILMLCEDWEDDYEVIGNIHEPLDSISGEGEE